MVVCLSLVRRVGVAENHFRGDAEVDPLRDGETINTEFRPPKGLGRDS